MAQQEDMAGNIGVPLSPENSGGPLSPGNDPPSLKSTSPSVSGQVRAAPQALRQRTLAHFFSCRSKRHGFSHRGRVKGVLSLELSTSFFGRGHAQGKAGSVAAGTQPVALGPKLDRTTRSAHTFYLAFSRILLVHV